MSLEEGFLHDICTNPEDVTPRLVYADWLDDRGGKGDAERAEFIRLQCRLHGKDAIPEKDRRKLRQRAELLLAAWKGVWNKPLKGMFRNYEFKRGFVERATMNAQKFLEHGDRILSLTPLRLVKLRDPADQVDALAAFPTLERLWGLNLNYGKIGAARAEKLLASPHLNNLRWLDLGNNAIRAAGAKALTGAKLSGLRFLALDDNEIGDRGLRTLAESPFLDRIEALNLDGNHLTDEGIRALAESPHAGRLAQLHLARNRAVQVPDVERLLSSPRLPSLRWLFLDGYTARQKEVMRLRKRYRHVEVNNDSVVVSLEYGPVAKL